MAKKEFQALVAEQKILNKIYIIRGQKVMLDEDLSEIYGVETKRLNEQVKRNIKRFPKDFMFEISIRESAPTWSRILRLQVGAEEEKCPEPLRNKA